MRRSTAHRVLVLICVPAMFGLVRGLQLMGIAWPILLAGAFPVGWLVGRGIALATEDMLFDDDFE